MRSAFFTVLPAALFLGLSGCDKEPSVEEKMAQIKKQFDGMRRCGNLFYANWPIEFDKVDLEDSTGGVGALFAAGLIRLEPIKSTDESGGLVEDDDKIRIVPTPHGNPHIVIYTEPDGRDPEQKYAKLCYGTVKVISVAKRHKGNPDPRYDWYDFKYQIVNPPLWTKRADIRAAFPDMAKDLSKVHSEVTVNGSDMSDGYQFFI
jgi:hypothetical protein